ncbi:hypothetical protein ACP70R_008059 [Stipagrostis hirtigluma subsp. patula]
MEFRRQASSSIIPLFLLLVAAEVGLVVVAASGDGYATPAACWEAIPGEACEDAACDASCRDLYGFRQGGACGEPVTRAQKRFCECRDGMSRQPRLIAPVCADETCAVYCKLNKYPLEGKCEMVSAGAPLCKCRICR